MPEYCTEHNSLFIALLHASESINHQVVHMIRFLLRLKDVTDAKQYFYELKQHQLQKTDPKIGQAFSLSFKREFVIGRFVCNRNETNFFSLLVTPDGP